MRFTTWTTLVMSRSASRETGTRASRSPFSTRRTTDSMARSGRRASPTRSALAPATSRTPRASHNLSHGSGTVRATRAPAAAAPPMRRVAATTILMWSETPRRRPAHGSGADPCMSGRPAGRGAVVDSNERLHLSLRQSVGSRTKVLWGNPPHRPSPPRGERVAEAPFRAYEAVFDASPDGIVVVDGRGRISAANPQALRMLGYTLEELVGQPVEIMVPPSVRGRHVALRDGFMERPASRPMGADMELRAIRKDGRELPVDVALRPVGKGEDRFVIAVIRDTTRERRMQTLGTGALRATEEERKRIARELHDDTAQSLAAIMMRLGVLEKTTDEGARARIHTELNDALEGLVEGVGRIARGLRPPALEDVGVEAAIRSQVRTSLEGSGIAVRLHLEPVADRLSEEAQLVVYRIVQEALSNVRRHSGATTVEVCLSVEGEGEHAHVVATVTDDGRGFDAEGEFLAGAGLGLIGMDERARILGGRLMLSSAPGEGCMVRLRIPAPSGSSRSANPEASGV
ncbi:MAG: PAS domain-containing sensor histidine kinase [Gemmatimonadales bacterium]|nr:MAG: PAS domain-containing sensor histidine kinase [Gemmatimonadales bacterium]